MNKKREQVLTAVIKQMLVPLKNIPFDVIIESLSGNSVVEYDNHAIDDLNAIVEKSGALINANGITSNRPNEVGNKCEPFVIAAINEKGFEADTPEAASGKKKAMGYPDIEALIQEKPFYIEVKSYNPRNKNTTQRSFYLSPSSDFKVTKDAYHLIFAFEIKKVGENLYKTTACTVLDAKNLLCDVKYEFNSDNHRMYDPSNDLIVLEKKF